ncbi:putative secreted protein (Por secretion system target) [Kordia periserrulae]|uniref:Putative secreted protein (Por secretion system target) n=1 Tax=Kordia periserrulae TaxID=701523 RepID=A0A2T6BVX1_9FLAO|nr:LamG-like jellyroll fold domain-containing protein [Kordia periserrulae]PTX60211.1 putative secreted protein (Por secretion system target) [Kordia periserrulae]
MKKTYSFLALLLCYSFMYAQYCVPPGGFTAPDPSGEHISRVQLNTMDNNQGISAPASGYNDFTGSVTPTDLEVGTNYNITITKTWTGAMFNEAIAVWIDYNQDGDFVDSGESVFTSSPNTTTPIVGNFTIPISALTGNTRMRVQMKGDDPIFNSCESYLYGEVEDYTVNITNSSLPPDITVTGNAVEIADGAINVPSTADHTDFGSVFLSGGFLERTYTITNSGTTTDLTLTASPVSFGTGSNTDFSIVSQPTDLVLSSGESTTFTIRYTPTVAGAATAVIEILNDDPDPSEQTFSFNIGGNGVVPIPSPGNISTNLQLWLKANVGTTLTGTDVDSWTDQSPNGFTAVSQGTTDAQIVTDGLNYNPVLRFTGNQFLNLGDQPELDLQPLTDEMTIITMVITNGTSTGTVICKGDNNVRNYQVWFGTTDRVLHHTLGRTGGGATQQAVRWGTIYALNEPKLTAGVVANTGDPLTRLTPYMNGVLDPADRNDGILSGDAAGVDVLIGARRNSGNSGTGYRYNGDIAEVIVYDRDLTTAELERVESYLALKYGITLGSNDAFWDTPTNTASPFGYAGTSKDYVDSNGTVIWDGSVNAGYGYNVFGIARDDNSQFVQTQSSSVNIAPADVLTITKESGSFDSNLSYLIVGNNGLTETIQTTTLPERTTRMLEKIWVARESSVDVGTVELEFDLSSSGIANIDDLELYIADSDTFTAFENYQGTNVGGVVTFTGVNLEDGQYFTLADPETVTGTNALFFDGVDDYVEDKSPTSVSLTDYTIMGWVRNPGQSSPTANRTIMGVEGQFRFYLSGGLLAIQEGQTGGTPRAGTGTLTDWVHFAIVVNTSTGTARNYLNGFLIGGGGIDPLPSNTNPFRMGTFNNTSFFTGYIDEVRIFDVALTEDQLREMVHQEIVQNGSNVRGSVIPKDIEDFTSGANVAWSSLVGYYNMSSVTGNRIEDLTGNDNTLFMKNMSGLVPQTAPMPYVSVADGNWTDDATWEHGTIWDTPSANSINWSIVDIKNDVTASANYSTLGLLVDTGASLTMTGANPIVTSTAPLTVTNGTGFELINTWYTKLDGVIDLNGESQFRQTERSDLDVTSAGYVERDQQGTASLYTYNYWSSPVSDINTTANNQDFTLGDVLLDGTNPSTPGAIVWTTNDDGNTSPFTISSEWIFKYVNGADEDYNAWQFVRNTGSISPGEGYTMKGVSSTADELEEQNYVFRGKPNNGVITVGPLDDGNLYLVGNPYLSALDANEFINDNIANDATTGTIFLWEHWGGGTHNLLDYQGGYATYTLGGGTPALSHPSVSQTGSGTKTPRRFIPVGQGFFVQGDSNAGNGITTTVEFNNSQRGNSAGLVIENPASILSLFTRETADETGDTGMFENSANRPASTDETVTTEFDTEPTPASIREDKRQKIRLGYKNPEGYHRQILLTFDRNATDNVDLGYEGKSIGVVENDMYWALEGDKYVIQAVQNLYNDRVVPIGLVSETNGGGLIKLDAVENISDNIGIYIKNNFTGATHNLRESDFQVDIPVGETNDKYSLVFKPESVLSTNEAILEEGIIMYTDTKTEELVITNNTNFKLENMEMHTILGQQIKSIDEGLQENVIRIPIHDVASGIYVISIYSEAGKISKKLVVQ